jgi:hypothetical protein
VVQAELNTSSTNEYFFDKEEAMSTFGKEQKDVLELGSA